MAAAIIGGRHAGALRDSPSRPPTRGDDSPRGGTPPAPQRTPTLTRIALTVVPQTHVCSTEHDDQRHHCCRALRLGETAVLSTSGEHRSCSETFRVQSTTPITNEKRRSVYRTRTRVTLIEPGTSRPGPQVRVLPGARQFFQESTPPRDCCSAGFCRSHVQRKHWRLISREPQDSLAKGGPNQCP